MGESNGIYLSGSKLAAAFYQSAPALVVKEGLPGAHLGVNALPAEGGVAD